MKKIIFLLLISLFFVTSCNKSKVTPLIGKVFTYQNGPEKQTVGFSDDKIYLKWNDSLGSDAFESDYNLINANDSVITVTLKNKPLYWESNKWDIVVKEDGFYSLSSKKYYKLNSQK
jgi:hypothetical protein